LDLFAGTGAISFEFVSRECSEVTAVEMANTQANFIKSVKQKLSADNLRVIKGDVFKFVETCSNKFDIIFADPPYDHPRFGEIPSLILNSQMIKPGTLVIVEHSRDYDFSELPHFSEQRTYGSVNFSLFQIPE
ncbi:MAG: RsmD family RNA methyltransferase, partial [Muribaculaceae bacterium]|nr:RsmD family RNA methyltransferase [Muribaculaceae bacterium]